MKIRGGFSVPLLVLALAACGSSGARPAAHARPSASAVASSSPAADALVQAVPATAADTTGITGVRAWQGLEQTHVTQPVTYFTYPPVGGPHAPVWLDCGEYATTPPWENAVHDLEHGAVIITFRPDLPRAQVAVLEADLKATPTVVISDGTQTVDTHLRYLDLWPFAEQTDPIVLSAWGHQLAVDDASDPRIPQFVTALRVHEGISPEYGASCSGGIGTPMDGTS